MRERSYWKRSDEAILVLKRRMDCFASLAMTEISAFQSLLRVEQRHRRIHHHLDQADAVMRKAALERAREFRCLAHAHGVAAHAFGDLDEIDAGQIEAGHVAHLHHLAERAHRAVAGIVDHHHRQRQLALRRGPQRLDRIHRRAVADQANGPRRRGVRAPCRPRPAGRSRGRRSPWCKNCPARASA